MSKNNNFKQREKEKDREKKKKTDVGIKENARKKGEKEK